MNDLDLTADPLSDKELTEKYISHRPLVSKTRAKPKKVVKSKKPIPARIVATGTTSWKKLSTIVKYFKSLNPYTIDFVVTGTSKGAEQFIVQACKHLGITVIQFHPFTNIPNSSFLSQGRIMKMFKPTMVIGFNEAPGVNACTENYVKLCRRSDIDIKIVSK